MKPGSVLVQAGKTPPHLPKFLSGQITGQCVLDMFVINFFSSLYIIVTAFGFTLSWIRSKGKSSPSCIFAEEIVIQ